MFEKLKQAQFRQLNQDEKKEILQQLAEIYHLKLKAITDETALFEKNGSEFIFIPQMENQSAMFLSRELHEIGVYPIHFDDPRIEKYHVQLLQNTNQDVYLFDGQVRFTKVKDEWQAGLIQPIEYRQFLQDIERDGFSLLSYDEWKNLIEMQVIEMNENEIILDKELCANSFSALSDERMLAQVGYHQVIRIDEELKPKKASLLTSDQLHVIQSCDEGSTGYFGLMKGYLLEYIAIGIDQGIFSEQEALEDVEIALWYAYACNNLDAYEQYYDCCQWMKYSYKNATGCGVWYYRYSVALMYCGKVEEAYQYAKQGAKEDPTYPWIWLELAKLHNHFKQREQALAAVEKGLSLVPNDYEFLTLKKEIEKGYVLEQMEYHWINPQQDEDLQNEVDKEKLATISCILCDEEALKDIKDLLNPKDWIKDQPYCSYHEQVEDHQVEIVFKMNEAALSKKNLDWIDYWRNVAIHEDNQIIQNEDGVDCQLTAVLIELNDDVTLVYYAQQIDQYFEMHFTQKQHQNLN